MRSGAQGCRRSTMNPMRGCARRTNKLQRQYVDQTQAHSVNSDPAEVVRLRLRTPPRVPRFLYGVSILSAMTFVMVWGGLAASTGGMPLLALLAAAGGAIPLWLAANREPPLTPVVELGFDRLRLPRTADLADPILLTYREIDALFMRPGRAGFVWVGTASTTFMYPLRSFRSTEDAERLYNELQKRIEARLPDGSARLAAFEQSANAALAAYRRPLMVTILLVVAIIAGAIGTIVLGEQNIFSLVHAGAMIPALVLQDGQWWRVVTAGWLSMPHDGLIAATTVGVFGIMVERLFGPTQTLGIATLSLWVGGAMSLLSEQTLGLGATPMAVAFYAALAFTAHSRPTLLPVGFRPPGVWWIATGVLLFALTFTLSEQDPSALIGGALVGVLLTAARIDDGTTLPLTSPAPWALRGLVVASVVATLVAGGFAVRNALEAPDRDVSALLAVADEKDWGERHIWNQMAWRVATADRRNEEHLSRAASLVTRSIKRADSLESPARERNKSAFLDTLATVHYRQGRYDDAVNRQQEALRNHPRLDVVTQLARFLDARAASGSSTVTAGLPNIKLTHDVQRGFLVTVSEPVDSPMSIWGVVRTAERIQGILQFSLDTTSAVGEPISIKEKTHSASEPEWTTDVHLVPGDVRSGQVPWVAWGADTEILALP